MSILGFFEWLATTRGSIALHESLYVYQIVSTIHVVTLSLFVGTAVMLDLRLLGATLRGGRVSEVAARLRPWTIAGFLLMVMSGALLFYANPVPRYQDIFFRAKMVLLVMAAINAWVFHARVCRNIADWDGDPVPPRTVRMAGGVALVVWGATIMSGRMIAYDWFDCDRQPQPAVVNVLAGCVTDSSEAPPRTGEHARSGSASPGQRLIARALPPQHAGKRVLGAPVPRGRRRLDRVQKLDSSGWKSESQVF